MLWHCYFGDIKGMWPANTLSSGNPKDSLLGLTWSNSEQSNQRILIKGRMLAGWLIFMGDNIMWHWPVWSIAAGHPQFRCCRYWFFWCIKSTDSHCFSVGHANPQNCPFLWEDLDPSDTWFPRPTRVYHPIGILIRWDIFAELTSVTNSRLFCINSDSAVKLLTNQPISTYSVRLLSLFNSRYLVWLISSYDRRVGQVTM